MELRFILNYYNSRSSRSRSDTRNPTILTLAQPFDKAMSEAKDPAGLASTEGDLPTSERAMSQLAAGASGRVARVLGDAADTLRLKELGLCEGREFRVLRTGDAWVVRVLGSRIGLSQSLAASVIVTAA